MFFAAVEMIKNPSLRGKAVVVGGVNSKHGVVSTASYEARKAGIHSAMPIAVARRLKPDAVFLEGDYAAYQSYSVRMFSLFRQYASALHVLSIDEADLDITETIQLYGGEEILALRLKSDVQSQLGFNISIGVAGTRTIAKIAAARAKPDGLTIIAQGFEKAFLSDLPINVLPGIGKKSEPFFISKGFTKVGDLFSYNLTELTKLFGKYGASLWYMVQGIEEERNSPSHPSISKEITFEEDITDQNQLISVLDQLSADLGHRLRHEKQEASCLSIKLRYANFKTITRQITLNQPIFSDEQIFYYASLLLRKESREPVRLLGICVTSLSAGESLFLEDQKERAFSRILDTIRDKFGSKTIHRYHDYQDKV